MFIRQSQRLFAIALDAAVSFLYFSDSFDDISGFGFDKRYEDMFEITWNRRDL